MSNPTTSYKVNSLLNYKFTAAHSEEKKSSSLLNKDMISYTFKITNTNIMK